ncbi:hypothetical protein PAXRUDRAFT_10387 [Paxillus rubicundulus Ve08.2h10]|uniref:Uncharacterized protein n=1 Tax=Paxillus rubicundulus Ve08.2h10 TaxID=930991 RepID=A0A0D0DGL0_9AGAM|nr:hypothetical protein PAXRUDRAFT_10387 [Paxillus rubicundulus Ve08.2h10]
MSVFPPVLNVHTPTSSLAIVHSLNDETMQQLYDKLTRKCRSEFCGQRVGPGWIKYYWNDTVWNLEDDSDYAIFAWRQKSPSSSDPNNAATMVTLHVHDPAGGLPEPPAYRNPAFYMFQNFRHASPQPRSERKAKPRKVKQGGVDVAEIAAARHRKDFERFHSENGVRTVMGSIGPVENVRMLLKSGYRHVYISRKFALKHGFIPADAAPGHYGYGGLVNLGKWPITLTPAASFPSQDRTGPHAASPPANGDSGRKPHKTKSVSISVYLSEEPHFDVVLGRSFFECRQIQTSSIDPTEVVCMDTGEKIECEVVVLKDGRGEIVIVT